MSLALSACGGGGCEELAKLVCACKNLPQAACESANAHAAAAKSDESGMREEECNRVADKFDCNIPDFIVSDKK